MGDRIRLDIALERRGFAQSRSRARDAILRGTVSVNGEIVHKPGALVGDGDEIAIADPAGHYVSRAALKLIAGLDAGGIDPHGRICLDVGSSTGGFTQVLAERGAERVYAVDVGTDQLHPSVRALPAVIVLEQTNAKELTQSHIPDAVDLLVCDVSFVSVTKVLSPALALCRSGADAVILIKPQFEVGRDAVGKGGIVSDEAAIRGAVSGVTAFMEGQGWAPVTSLPSPLVGGDGNREIVAVFRRT